MITSRRLSVSLRLDFVTVRRCIGVIVPLSEISTDVSTRLSHKSSTHTPLFND